MKRLLLLLLLCPTTLLLAQHTDHIQEAMANYDYETALSLIAAKKPTTPLLLQKGKALRGLGLNTEALSTYQEIITNDTTNSRAFIEAAECCRTLAKSNQALEYYERALDLNPENKYVRIQYINLLLSLQKFRDALGESSLMTEKDSSAIALHLQAQSFEGMGEPLPAAGCYYNIQEKYPSDYLAAAKLGAINIAGSYFDEAIEATEKYRQIDTTNIAVNRQNALAYCLKQDYPTAIRRYEYLINQGDSSFHTCYYLGISYYAVEKYYEAHDLLEVARKYDPENVNLLYYLGRACAKTSWKKQGVEYLEKAINLSIPKDSSMTRLYIGMTDCYKMAQMYKEQLASMKERYQKYDRQNHKILYDMAHLSFSALKDKKSTERYLEAFLKTRPKDDKTEQAKLNEKGELVLGMANYYNAAANWLKDLKSKQKIEDFFQNGKTEAIKKE
ncbi:tetratricopeptide repeat protein [uncultured Bacteroides sp.]|uniref:tetratricopeptide repeat protein n=1 Tax=uncultured Bacteroides sp. TaxID=162156 RepID=UPI0025D0D69F|nr:tetratricopeptide repeat protein [uncultured Bacteroides sp.]